MKSVKYSVVAIILLFLSFENLYSQSENESFRDKKIKEFLESNRNKWNDLNVPYQDGKLLYDLIVKNKFKSTLEIGTSTGHSTVWLAWALSKTGGKLTTVEIDERRQKIAIRNLTELGLADYVDFRLDDAHRLVKELDGPFDFVFSDADKGWYLQYFKDVDTKLSVNGIFTAHNVSNAYGGIKDFLDYVNSLKNYETTIDRSSRAGVSISRKISD